MATRIAKRMHANMGGQALSPRRIFVVDDHPVFREGLVQLVNSEHDLIVCGQASDAEQALKEISMLQPDLGLVDISLPGKNGLEVIKEIRGGNRNVKLLAVSMHDEALYAKRVINAGGDGYVMKQEDPTEIINAIRDVLAGHTYINAGVTTDKIETKEQNPSQEQKAPADLMTQWELEILILLGQKKTHREIASELQLPVKEVMEICAQIRTKLQLKTAKNLVRYARCWISGAKDL